MLFCKTGRKRKLNRIIGVKHVVAENLKKIESELSSYPTLLLPVSKTFPPDLILEAYAYGCRQFGENRVQELTAKYEVLPKDIEWHLIGHLQTNKVKYIAPFVSLIQSVDSLKLLSEIDRQAEKCGRIIRCLLQVFIAREETKFGFDPDEVRQLFRSGALGSFKHVQIDGLMGMATHTPDEAQIRAEFRLLRELFDELRSFDGLCPSNMEILSMGMSSDYLIACQEGSTMVRLGSSVFGSR